MGADRSPGGLGGRAGGDHHQRFVLVPPSPGGVTAYAAVYGSDADAPAELALALAHWAGHGFGLRLALEAGEPVAVVELGFALPGVVGFEEGEVEIGWIVAAARRGQGIATEAARAVADDALARPRLDHLGMRPRGEGRSRSGDPVTILERRR